MDNHSIHPEVKLTFADDKRFFGPGTVMLLREIDKCGNVRDACEKCGFSYSKGWTIIRKCEQVLGCRIVDRQVGGQSGGSSRVSEDGRRLLNIYEELLRELSELADKRYEELICKYRPGAENPADE